MTDNPNPSEEPTVIYLSGDDGKLKIVILETANLEELKKGRPAKSPDGTVVVAWTADPVWLADKLMDCDGDPKKIAALIDEATRRPEKPSPRPHHGAYLKKFLPDDAE